MVNGANLSDYLTGHWLTDLANFSAFVFAELPELNWAGFYLDDGKKLLLGPFVGKPACTEIRYDRGVCGAAFRDQKALRVDDVHEFPGHIACDSASRSEMVLPMMVGGVCVGVLDLDSPSPARFKPEDEARVQALLTQLMEKVPAIVWQKRPWA